MSFTVTDGKQNVSETITITVAQSNRAPVLAPIGNKSMRIGTTLLLLISATDPEKDALTYSATGLPAGATFAADTHRLTWTPTAVGTYKVTFTVSDGKANASETITITVAPENRAPTLETIADKTITIGQSLSFVIRASDANGDTLSYSATGLPAGATFAANSRTFSWTPKATQTGFFKVKFIVSDGELLASKIVGITVRKP